MGQLQPLLKLLALHWCHSVCVIVHTWYAVPGLYQGRLTRKVCVHAVHWLGGGGRQCTREAGSFHTRLRAQPILWAAVAHQQQHQVHALWAQQVQVTSFSYNLVFQYSLIGSASCTTATAILTSLHTSSILTRKIECRSGSKHICPTGCCWVWSLHTMETSFSQFSF